jgi:opacity protein-like surface antigen
MKTVHFRSFVLFSLFTCLVCPKVMAFDTGLSEIGIRGGASLGNGEPANDIMGYGAKARFRLNDDWLVGVGLDQCDFDFEYPYKLLGIENSLAKAVDSKASALKASTFLERRFFEKPAGFSLHGALGFGINMVDVKDSGGPNDAGGFEITTDAGSEYVFSAIVGPRYRFAGNWSVEADLGVDYHMADWKVKDRISNKSATLDDYITFPFYAGVNYHF